VYSVKNDTENFCIKSVFSAKIEANAFVSKKIRKRSKKPASKVHSVKKMQKYVSKVYSVKK
jgi:hypothetical protein